MDTFDTFGCDPVYMDVSAPEFFDVDNYCYLHQVTSGDVQQQEQQEIWLCSVMNEEMDLTRSSLPYYGDFSVAPHHAMRNEAPIAVEHAPLSEIQLYAEVYNAANANAIGEYHLYPTAFPNAAIGALIDANFGPSPPQFPDMQDFNDVMYGGTAFPEAVEKLPPPPYTQYTTDDNNVYGQGQEMCVISTYSTLAPNLIPSYPEKQDHTTKTPTGAAAADSATSLTENREVPSLTVKVNEPARKTKKSNKKSLRDGKIGWIHCTPVAVNDSWDPDSPPTYRVVSHPRARRKLGGSKTPAKGEKKPRVAVVVTGADGEEKVLLFRSCVVKHFDQCKWDGCQDVVWTDRKSIREHMEMAHGVYWDPDERIACRWESCESNLSVDSLFRHITNTHMNVTRAPCDGCDEGYSCVDSRNRHFPKCSLKPSQE
ncbi:hypothetical protein F5887DRAFT_272677 [Amanita rubescens]|nr:hypothetical protein F5887DRAFT_272677 [Amanita rubescens]